jgi:L-amino acid N-acyltransferase YncA
VEIRAFTDHDWPTVWAIFAEVVAAGETYAYPWPMHEGQARALWVEDPPASTVVALLDDEIVGTAKMGPNRPGRGAHVATASFMVSAAARGKGVGRALGEYFLRWTAQERFHGIQFNAVVETNTAAIALWQDLGFDIIGTVPEAFDHPTHGLVGLYVMYRRAPS